MVVPTRPIQQYKEFNAGEFQARMRKALESVATILDVTRSPKQLSDLSHTYDDKYLMAEFVTNTAIAAFFNVLEAIGVNADALCKMWDWSGSRSVTLRFSCSEQCSFSHEKTYKVESASRQSSYAGLVKVTSKTTTRKTDYYWKFKAKYRLVAFRGSDPLDCIELLSEAVKTEIMTASNHTPRPKSTEADAIDVNITWLLCALNSDMQAHFAIDRTHDRCHTPRRNPFSEAALEKFGQVGVWAEAIRGYLLNGLFPAERNHSLNMGAVSGQSIFVPVIPLAEKRTGDQSDPPLMKSLVSVLHAPDPSSCVLSLADLNAFLERQVASIDGKLKELDKQFPASKGVITQKGVKLVAMVDHLSSVCDSYWEGVDHIEYLLRQQLAAAVGKELVPKDFADYMRYHNRKLFARNYQPSLFSYAIRRAPLHDPEGEVEITCRLSSDMPRDPVTTMARKLETTRSMKFMLNAGTAIAFEGDQYVHSLIAHQFNLDAPPEVELHARARQFSGFVMLVGRIAAADTFIPAAAVIIQNKDDVRIPLLMETIPSAKAFKKATQSLSDEMQRFASAYRSMQLESTLFGLCIVQIKPQLELLLNLPFGSLTKEIRLTQDLLDLFITYNIPSDLLSCSARSSATDAEKIAQVKAHVKSMQEIIERKKQAELDEEKMRMDFRVAELSVCSSESESDADCGDYDDDDDCYALDEECEQRSCMMECEEDMMMKEDCGMDVASFGDSMQDDIMEPEPSAGECADVEGDAGETNNGEDKGDEGEKTPEKKEPDLGQIKDKKEDALIDFTEMPARLDKLMEELDDSDSVRPTIIRLQELWWLQRSTSLLAGQSETKLMNVEEQGSERTRAYDLIDALSRCGALPLRYSQFHVVMAATHCFEETLVNTLIQKNENPIETYERSELIAAHVVQDVPVEALLQPDQVERVKTYSPGLFPAE